MEAARWLGDRLLREESLTAGHVRLIVEEARVRDRRERSMARLKQLATQAQFAARINNDAVRTAEIKRIIKEMQQVIE